MRTSFEEVNLTGVKYIKENGKRKRKQKTFLQTINPFNTNNKGEIKTRIEIYEELQEEIKEWKKEDEVNDRL